MTKQLGSDPNLFKTKLAHQGICRHQRQCRQNPNLVRCMHLRGGGHCKEKTRVGGVNARHLAGPQLVLVRGQAADRTAR